MRRGAAILAMVLLGIPVASCGTQATPPRKTTTAPAPVETTTTTTAAGTACPAVPFTGTASAAGDDGGNAPFELSDGDVVLAQAFALSSGVQYTVYLADYDLAGQTVGVDTVEAAPGQVVITMQARHPDFDVIEVGVPYEETFVIMDSGGGAMGSPDDPSGTVTFLDLSDDRICFEVDFSDTGQVLRGTVSAEVVGGF